MKKLELNQMENLEGGKKTCAGEGMGFLTGATVAGTLFGGPVGFMAGGLIGLVGGTFISITKAC